MLALAAIALAIPLHFEPNQGQLNPQVRFTAVTKRYTLELSDTAIAVNSASGPVRLNLPRTRPEGVEELTAKSSYYLGSDPSKWRTGIPNFARVRYRNVFHGVDLVVYGNGQRIEYDWIVAAGADPRSIRFSLSGASPMRIDSSGDLVLGTGSGEVRHTRPRILQSGREIAGRFVLRGGEAGFEIGPYDRGKPLVIDPVLVVNTGFGGSGSPIPDQPLLGEYGGTIKDSGAGIVTDSSGNIYVTGGTASMNFPLVASLEDALPECNAQNCEFSAGFVTKLSPDGSTLLYSTYIGPQSFPLYGAGGSFSSSIAIDAGGTVYVAGTTYGANFPGATATAGGYDAFLLRLNPQGALIGTLLFGGSGDEFGTSMVLGADGYIYLGGTTTSPDFPVTQNSYLTTLPGPTSAFLVKVGFNSAFGSTKGTALYSTYVGPGTSAAVAADAGGNAYIAAATTSAAWPATSGVVQPACAGANCSDIVVAKLDPLGQKLIYATYLGGSQMEALGGIAVDTSGNAYVSGATYSPDFPVTSGAFETQTKAFESQPSEFSPGAPYTGFVAKLSPDATKFVYATYLGGSANDRARSVAVDTAGNTYVGGTTTSLDFPLLQALQATPVSSFCPYYEPGSSMASIEYNCANGGFLSVLIPSGSALVWSTYLGSGAVDAVTLDAAGNVYATGLNIAVNDSMAGTIGVLKIAPGPSPLDVPANAIVNAASYAPGLPLPGGLASVFLRGLNLSGPMIGTGSPLQTELAGVSIVVGGVPAPILAVAPLASGMQQINFQVPFEAASNQVEIRYQGTSVFAIPQTAAPGIFALSDGTPAIQHSTDYSLVTPSNPAQPGEVIIVYATGLGPVSPAVASGVAATGPAKVAPLCGGISAGQSTPPSSVGILYAGLTPGSVGLYQLNIQVPQSQPAGMAQISISASICHQFPAGSLQSNIVNLPVQ